MTGRALRSGVVLALFSLFFGLCTGVQASFRVYQNLEMFVSHPAQAALWTQLQALATQFQFDSMQALLAQQGLAVPPSP